MVKVKMARSGAEFAGGVHRNIAELVGLICNEIERRGYRFVPGWCWGASCRAIAGTSRASNHSWGLAIDMNAPNNPYTSSGVHDIPDWAFALFRSYGFGLGADYSGKQDWMHAEFQGNVSDAAIMTGLARKNIGGGVVTPPPTGDDDMSAAELNTLIGKIDNLKNLLFQQGFDTGGHSIREEVGWATDKVIMPKLNGISDQLAQVPTTGAVGGKPDTYACVVDDDSGAWYAVAPGHFWHIENMMEVAILRASGVLVGGESHLNHGDVVHLRTMVLRQPGEAGDPPPPATYTVVSGDTLSGIAVKTGKSVADLSAWNGISDPNSINIGQVLKLGPQ
jgi:hypothetical protein